MFLQKEQSSVERVTWYLLDIDYSFYCNLSWGTHLSDQCEATLALFIVANTTGKQKGRVTCVIHSISIRFDIVLTTGAISHRLYRIIPMCYSHVSLKKAIETLKALQIETHDAMDDSHRERFKQAIKDLEGCEQQQKAVSSLEILRILGQMLNFVPSIERIISNLPM